MSIISEEENIAIETLKEVASDDFGTLGDDISPKMAQNILNVINNQQKEIERLNGTINSIYYHYLECRELEKEINENWEDKIRKIILNKRKKVLEKNYSNLSIVKRIYKRNIQVAMLDTLLKELLEEN